MSFQGDIARENDVKFFAELIKKVLESHNNSPTWTEECTAVLKKLGRDVLALLPNVPEWSAEYEKLFREEVENV